MNRLVPSLIVALAVTGCAKNSALPTARFSGPTDVAAYRGYGLSAPGALRHFIAVANTRGDDLRIIDAVNDKTELSATLVAALSVPTEPRPSVLAAGRLNDLDTSQTPAAPLALPDLLVVAPAGLVARPGAPGQFAAVIQLVVTWEEQTRVLETLDLGLVAPGATVLSMAVTPVLEPVPGGGWQKKAGFARVVAGMSDGSLLTIEARRAQGSEAIALGDPLLPDHGITRQDLGFTALDLAVAPDGGHLYAATTEPIPGPGGTLGAAELDLTAAPGAFPIRAIGARAGTTRVAALDVAPFIGNDPAPLGSAAKDRFGPAVPRVLAAIDSQACGRDRSVPCGVAILDPVAGGMAADPAGELPYQMPLQVPGEVVDLAVSGPPIASDGFMELAPGSGKRWTQSMAAISSSSGRVYLADLSHFALANDISSLTGNSRARVASSASFVPTETSTTTVGFWQLLPPEPPSVDWKALDGIYAAFGVVVTPGFTPTDSWAVVYQGVLPGLKGRLAVAQVPDTGAPQPPSQVALQEDANPKGSATHNWRGVVRVYDPRLAIQPRDIVEIQASDVVNPDGSRTNPCPLGSFEMVVTALLPPTADAPGGALALAVPSWVQPTNPNQPSPADTNCLSPGASEVTVNVRAWGYVAAGQATGYVGRPPEVFDAATSPPFQVRYENEDLLSCPIMPDAPEAWPPPAAAVDACEADVAACRATCERLVVARRARRLFYVTNRCDFNTERLCYDTWRDVPASLTFPLPNGPALSFKLAVLRPDAKPGEYPPPDRGTSVTFITGSGFSPAVRIPYLGGASTSAVLPGGILLHDRSEATGVATESIHGFAAFTGNLVLDFSAGGAGQNAVVIR